MKKFAEKYLVGAYCFKIFGYYTTVPKISPIMMLGIYLAGFYQDSPLILGIGTSIIAVGLFGFFYFNIFPDRRPKTQEESEKLTTFLN